MSVRNTRPPTLSSLIASHTSASQKPVFSSTKLAPDEPVRAPSPPPQKPAPTIPQQQQIALAPDLLALKHALTAPPPPRKIRKINNKKFVFDWDAKEDTAAKDLNPIYEKRHEARLYGRGHFAGISVSNA